MSLRNKHDDPDAEWAAPAPGRYCLARCYCGRCPGYTPVPSLAPPTRAAPAEICLPAEYMRQAESDAAARQAARHADGCDVYGKARDGGDEYDHHLEWHRQSRVTELAVERWLGLPLLPDMPFGAHFDTNPPWCVQVKPMRRLGSPVRLRNRPGLCPDCPYVFACITGPAVVTLVGWVTLDEVRQAGRLRDFGDTSAWEAPATVLHRLDEAGIASFRAGPAALCPLGRRV